MEELLGLGLEEFVQVVSASKRPQSLREAPATVRIVAGTYRKYLDLTDDVDGEDRHEPAEDEPEEESWVRRRSRRERRTASV